MERINCFKTSDGKIFKDENIAKNHEKKITMKIELKQFLNDSDFVRGDICNVLDLILENHEKLLKIIM